MPGLRSFSPSLGGRSFSVWVDINDLCYRHSWRGFQNPDRKHTLTLRPHWPANRIEKKPEKKRKNWRKIGKNRFFYFLPNFLLFSGSGGFSLLSSWPTRSQPWPSFPLFFGIPCLVPSASFLVFWGDSVQTKSLLLAVFVALHQDLCIQQLSCSLKPTGRQPQPPNISWAPSCIKNRYPSKTPVRGRAANRHWALCRPLCVTSGIVVLPSPC